MSLSSLFLSILLLLLFVSHTLDFHCIFLFLSQSLACSLSYKAPFTSCHSLSSKCDCCEGFFFPIPEGRNAKGVKIVKWHSDSVLGVAGFEFGGVLRVFLFSELPSSFSPFFGGFPPSGVLRRKTIEKAILKKSPFHFKMFFSLSSSVKRLLSLVEILRFSFCVNL